MINISSQLKLVLDLAKVQAILVRRFDGGLGGLGFSEFMILYYLSQAKDEKMRRIDLANKIGLTASGVTRLLLPMEKTGLIKREANAQDARVSYVMIAQGGKRRLTESLEDAEALTAELIPSAKSKKMQDLSKLLKEFASFHS